MANRGVVWADAEVRALIGFWGDSRIQAELDGAVRNKAIHEKIAMKMAEAGFNRDWKQCRAKIKNLKNDYKKIKDSNNRSGQRRQVMQFFDQLDAVLAVRDATRPPQVLESSGSLEPDSEPEEEEEETDNADSPDVESSDASQGQMQSVETEVSTPSLSISSDTSVTSEVPDEEASKRADGTSAAEGPPSKKSKTVKKVSKAEKMIGGIMEKFIEYQQNAESRFLKYEEERRKSDREHEERMMAMISMMCQTQMHMYYPRAPPHYPYQQGTGNSATHNIPPPLRYPYPAGAESVDDFPAFDANTDEDS